MVERISNPTNTKRIIEQNKFYFRKNFGQNFLVDGNVLENIIHAAGITKDDFVLEIGPGIGSLTQYLAESAQEVLAIEIDRNLMPILGQTLKDYGNIEILNQDILKTDINAIIEVKNNGQPIKVVANLPYYITTPIIMDILEKRSNVKSITVMVQKEVGDRICAKPSTKDYGSLSIAAQFYSEPKVNFIVPPNCFMPRPTVDSAVITLEALTQKPITVYDEGFFFHIVKCAFSQRRKTLINTLHNTGKLGLSKQEISIAITRCGLSERIRGEALSIGEFARLADSLYEAGERKEIKD